MTKNPKTKHAKVKPDNRYKGLLQVGLQTQAVKLKLSHTYICSPLPGQLREDTAENRAEG
jgi:hypothetical protein